MRVSSTTVDKQIPQVKTSKGNTAATSRDFLWIDCQGLKSVQSRSHDRETQSFIRTRNHRLQRDERLRKLRGTIKPLPTESLKRCATEQKSKANGWCPTNDRLAGLVFYRGPKAGLQEAFPSFSMLTSTHLDFYFQTYRDYTAKIGFPLCASDMINICAQEALDQPIVMQTMLTLGASSWASILGAGNASSAVVRHAMHDSLMIRGQIIESIQKMIIKLSRPQSEALLLTMTQLFGVECAEGNMKAVAAHAHGIKVVIDKLGGLDGLSDQVLTSIAVADVMNAMNTALPLEFDMPPEWTARALASSPLLNVNKDTKTPDTLGAGFFTSPWSHDQPLDLLSSIQALQRLIPYHERYLEQDKQSVLVANDYLVVLTRNLLDPSLEVRLTPFQNTIRLSVLIYCFTRIWAFSKKACMLNIVRILRSTLDKCLETFQRSAPDLLIWVFFMGSLASYVGHGTEYYAWASHGLAASAEQLSIFEWDDAVPILQRFLFFLRRNDSAKCIWDEMRHPQKQGIGIANGTFYRVIRDSYQS